MNNEVLNTSRRNNSALKKPQNKTRTIKKKSVYKKSGDKTPRPPSSPQNLWDSMFLHGVFIFSV